MQVDQENSQKRLAELQALLQEQFGSESVDYQQFFQSLQQLCMLVDEEQSLGEGAMTLVEKLFEERFIAQGKARIEHLYAVSPEAKIPEEILEEILSRLTYQAILDFATTWLRDQNKSVKRQPNAVVNWMLRHGIDSNSDRRQEAKCFIRQVVQSSSYDDWLVIVAREVNEQFGNKPASQYVRQRYMMDLRKPKGFGENMYQIIRDLFLFYKDQVERTI